MRISSNVAGQNSYKTARWVDFDAIAMVWQRALVRFLRQRTRLVGGMVRSIVWLFALGVGLRRSFVPVEGYDYAQYIFPGIIAMAIIFSAVQSAISIVWDREFGFLREILVAPIPRASIVLGKALGAATTSTIQGALILVFAPLAGVSLSFISIALSLMAMFVTAICMSSLGIVIAARLSDFESFSSLQNFVTMPMFLLSGAMFPVVGLPDWFHIMLLFNPLTYGVDLMRGSLLNFHVHSVFLDVVILFLFAFIMLAYAIRLFEKEG